VVFILPCSVVVFLVKAKARCRKVTSVRASVVCDQFQFVLIQLFRVLLVNVINFFLFFFTVKQDNGVSLVLCKLFSCVKRDSCKTAVSWTSENRIENFEDSFCAYHGRDREQNGNAPPSSRGWQEGIFWSFQCNHRSSSWPKIRNQWS